MAVVEAMKRIFACALIGLSLGACSSKTEQNRAEEAEPASVAPTNLATPAPPAVTPANVRTIGLEGLGDLKIGQPIPAGSRWAERGAQTGEACRTVSSPDYPGVHAIVEGGKVRRISVGQGSDVKLVEGIGPGSPESDVAKSFVGFRAEPHKYEAAPAKYLTAPGVASGDPAVRFEIGTDGKVRILHVGTMPTLGYVEGCS